ncbi:unnamed protein product [Dicrocoelium dendriticum]|nr:unnamed protein product [Dicrocoelium dendriticum]
MANLRLGIPVTVILLSLLIEATSFRRFPSHRHRYPSGYAFGEGDSARDEQGARLTHPWRHTLEISTQRDRSDRQSSTSAKADHRRPLADENVHRPFRGHRDSDDDGTELNVRADADENQYAPGKYRGASHLDAASKHPRSSSFDHPPRFRWSRDFTKHRPAADNELKFTERDDSDGPRPIAQNRPYNTYKEPSEEFVSPGHIEPSMSRGPFAEGGKKKPMLLAARDLEPENERLDDSTPDWPDFVKQYGAKRGKRANTVWNERRDATDPDNKMSGRFLDTSSLERPKSLFSYSDLVEDEFDEPPSIYTEHFAREKPGSIGNHRDYGVEVHGRHVPRQRESVRFVAGSFDTEPSKKHLDSSNAIKEDGKQTANAAKKSAIGNSKTIMNVNLLMDQSGALKIEMNTPKKEADGKKRPERFSAVTNNGKQALIKDAADGHHGMSIEIPHGGQTKSQESFGSQRSGFLTGHINNPSETTHFSAAAAAEDSTQLQGTSKTSLHGSLEPPQSLLKSLLNTRTEHDNSKQKDTTSLLFGQLDSLKPAASNVKLSELTPSGYPAEKTTVIDFAPIPSLANVDNPLVSGCDVQKCSITCPGQLWKLSPLTGCPTCECCPSVNCKMPCKYGYDADPSGCPTCKCLSEH